MDVKNRTTGLKNLVMDQPDFSEMNPLQSVVEMDALESTRFLAYCEIKRWAVLHPENVDPRNPWFEQEVVAYREYLSISYGTRYVGVAFAVLDEVLMEARAAAHCQQGMSKRWNRYLTYGKTIQGRSHVFVDGPTTLGAAEHGRQIGGAE